MQRDVLDASAESRRHHRLATVHRFQLDQAELLGPIGRRHAEDVASVVVRHKLLVGDETEKAHALCHAGVARLLTQAFRQRSAPADPEVRVNARSARISTSKPL